LPDRYVPFLRAIKQVNCSGDATNNSACIGEHEDGQKEIRQHAQASQAGGQSGEECGSRYYERWSASDTSDHEISQRSPATNSAPKRSSEVIIPDELDALRPALATSAGLFPIVNERGPAAVVVYGIPPPPLTHQVSTFGRKHERPNGLWDALYWIRADEKRASWRPLS
jgi:hypothetical protein